MMGLHDIPLPLPANEALLKGMLVVFFLIHIVFVELMVGASCLTTYFEWLSLRKKNPLYDRLAYLIAKTITVNKSMAVVMGVGPLLLINVTYTLFFYSSSVLIGDGWILVIPIAIVAFLLTYLHQYGWEKFQTYKGWHITFSALATLLFFILPLFFLTNTNLMWFPHLWDRVQGFIHALGHANIWARYAFFLASCLTTTGLYLSWELSRSTEFNQSERNELGGDLSAITFKGMLGQLIAALALIFTLESTALVNSMWPFFILASVAFLMALYSVAQLHRHKRPITALHLKRVVFLLCIAIGCGGTIRHQYREAALGDIAAQVKSNTQKYLQATERARVQFGEVNYDFE